MVLTPNLPRSVLLTASLFTETVSVSLSSKRVLSVLSCINFASIAPSRYVAIRSTMPNETPKLPRSTEAALGAILFLLLGLGVVWFAKAVAGITSGAILSVLVIMPALLYVILRGDLAELRGPGGWAATFKVTTATV